MSQLRSLRPDLAHSIALAIERGGVDVSSVSSVIVFGSASKIPLEQCGDLDLLITCTKYDSQSTYDKVVLEDGTSCDLNIWDERILKFGEYDWTWDYRLISSRIFWATPSLDATWAQSISSIQDTARTQERLDKICYWIDKAVNSTSTGDEHLAAETVLLHILLHAESCRVVPFSEPKWAERTTASCDAVQSLFEEFDGWTPFHQYLKSLRQASAGLLPQLAGSDHLLAWACRDLLHKRWTPSLLVNYDFTHAKRCLVTLKREI